MKDREELIDEQIDAARNINDDFGIEKALGYIVGEKLFHLVEELSSCRNDPKPDPEAIRSVEALINTLSAKVVKTFSETELRNYFAANPRFGALGHVLSEDDHRLFVENDATKHTLDGEIKDALIMDEIKRYLRL